MIKCSYCKNEFEPSKYQLRQYKAGKPVYCCKPCATASRYNIVDTSTEEFINKLKYMMNETNKTYTEIQKELGITQAKFDELINTYNLKRSSERLAEIKINKMKQTMLEKYGVENSMEVDDFREKISISHSLRSQEEKQATIEKISNTKFEKYGDKNYHNIEKAKQTMIEKYGVDCGFKTDRSVQNRVASSIDKYGTDNPFKSAEVRDKGKEIIKEKYGVEYALQSDKIREKINNTMESRYGTTNPFSNKDIQDKQHNTLQERYGVMYGCQTPNCANSSPMSKSKINIEFSNFIEADKEEFVLDNYRYDCMKNNILIEINPKYTHNCYSNPFGNAIDKDYHYNKSLVAEKNGYHCIHVWDWDDWNKIKYLVQDKETLYARNLEVREVSIEDASAFLNEYHIQNTCKGQSIRLGLYKDDQLIELMTFGTPRYNHKYEYELLRLCTHKDYKVVGGSEKLFKNFLSMFQPSSIISYCDYSKFAGNVYTRLGFKQFSKPTPGKHWSKGNKHITDNLLRQRGYDQLFGTNYGKGTSNEQLMLDNGWLPLYDAGQITFIWTM